MKLVKLARRGGESIWVNPEYVVTVGWDHTRKGSDDPKFPRGELVLDGTVIRTTVDKEELPLRGDPMSVVAALEKEGESCG